MLNPPPGRGLYFILYNMVFSAVAEYFKGRCMLKNTCFLRNRLIAYNAIVAIIFIIPAAAVLLLGGSGLITVALAAAALIATTVITGKIVITPIHDLLSEVRKVRYGSQSGEIVVERNDEIGELAREYNLLRAALNHREEKIEKVNSRTATKIWSQTKELHYELKRLERCARTDALTGLSNRSRLDVHARQLYRQASKDMTDLACIMIDIDNFKDVNDTWGHAVGDKVIVFASELLRACTRSDDLCARLGGDEFVIMLNNCSVQKARDISERLRSHFAREVVKLLPGETGDYLESDSGRLGLSIGLAAVRRGRPRDVEELMRMADAALYKAKEKGRNCVMAY